MWQLQKIRCLCAHGIHMALDVSKVILHVLTQVKVSVDVAKHVAFLRWAASSCGFYPSSPGLPLFGYK